MDKALRVIFFWSFFTLSLSLFIGCDTSSLSSDDSSDSAHLHLTFNHEVSEYIYDGTTVLGPSTSSSQRSKISTENDLLRYIVRIYPAAQKASSKTLIKEFEFTKECGAGYNCEMTVDIEPGDYQILVWSDMLKDGKPLYDADDFAEITLLGSHNGNDAYLEAYRGSATVSKSDFSLADGACAVEVTMQRPLARFEIVANDLSEFIDKELANYPVALQADESIIELSDYSVVFYYVGFMPDTYSMYTDRTVDSSTGVIFHSELSRLTDSEASLGFDYVFVNDKDSAVTVRVGVYSPDGNLISMTPSIKVPLKRNYHTVLQNTYLTTKSSDGVNINPNYDGNYTVTIP